MNKKQIDKLINKNKSIKLDLACGENKTHGYIGIDIRNVKGVDIIHDLEKFPYPLPGECVSDIIASHIVEHIKPWLTIKLFDELWRIMITGGRLAVGTPYAGSQGFWQDPTHCLSEDTEILTDNGFRVVGNVRKGEMIATLNPLTNQMVYAPVSKEIKSKYSGEMVHFKSKRMDLLTTPNHSILFDTSGTNKKRENWQMDRADTFCSINTRSRKGMSTFTWDGEKTKAIEIPRIYSRNGKQANNVFDAESFMEFMGWYLSEGCLKISKRPYYTIQIAQSKKINPNNYARIIGVVKRLGSKPYLSDNYITISNKHLYNYLKPLGNSASKYIPRELMKYNSYLLSKMLAALIDGDGRKNSNGSGSEYATISKQLASDVQEVALKCGYRSTLYKEKRPPRSIIMGKEYNQATTMYLVGISKNTKSYYTSVKKVPYDGYVACVNVFPYHTILARRNGRVLWVGNCNGFNEITFQYFDPKYPLYYLYRPKPWRMVQPPSWQANGNLSVLMEKMKNADV